MTLGTIGVVERDRALWPYSVYRIALAATVLLKRGVGPAPPRGA